MTDFDRFRIAFDDLTGNHALRQVPNPPGFSSQAPSNAETRRQASVKNSTALQSRAIAPWKQVAVLCFMMFMTSNTIQIFSLLTTFSGIATSVQAILHSGETFKPDAEGLLDTFTPRLLFCLIHMAGVIFGIYKLNAIGLLPTHPSDWVSTLRSPLGTEYATTGIDVI